MPRKPVVGDECWFVEWTYELVWVDGDSTSEYREVDRDNCKVRTRRLATKDEAERLAKEVWPQTHDTFGIVEYWPARFTAYDEDDAAPYPHVGFWDATGEVEVYEGEMMQEPRILNAILKTLPWKGERIAPRVGHRLSVDAAAAQLVMLGHFKDVETARAALESGVPVETKFAYYELEKEETTPSPK